ncbi:MAG: hypothetical protein U0O22_08915 [Acutalibacteraceae bacterium]
MATEKKHSKLLVIYLAITFGVCWGISLLYAISYDTMASLLGELTLSNPVVVVALNSPGVAGLIIYLIYDGFKGLKDYLWTLVPRKKDLKWFGIIAVVMTLYIVCVRLVCILVKIDVPEITYTPGEMFIVFLKNFYEETGMIGQCCGWFGFMLPYLQAKFKSNIKAGLLTGLAFGLFLAPGYVFSSFETATAYPFYLIQMMCLSVCVSYVLNATKGNVLFFLLTFWIAATGSKIQLYYFVPSVQVVQIALFIVLFIIMHFAFKKINEGKKPEEVLQMFPDFIKREGK